jgi:hypothetical protein
MCVHPARIAACDAVHKPADFAPPVRMCVAELRGGSLRSVSKCASRESVGAGATQGPSLTSMPRIHGPWVTGHGYHCRVGGHGRSTCSGSETELHQSKVLRARACELVSDTVEPVSAFCGRKRFSGPGVRAPFTRVRSRLRGHMLHTGARKGVAPSRKGQGSRAKVLRVWAH